MIEKLVEILSCRQPVTDVDLVEGTMLFQDDDHTVRVHLDPALLNEFAARLDVEHILGLPQAAGDRRESLCLNLIAIFIEELYEADIEASVEAIYLGRGAGEDISIERRRGQPQRPLDLDPSAGGLYRTADRPKFGS